MIVRKEQRTARVGIFAVGHKTYWGQFEGLMDKLLRYYDVFKDLVFTNQVEVFDFGIADDSMSAYNIMTKMKAGNLDLVFCDMLTYATSASFAPIIRNVDVPVVLAALQPLPALDYSKANTLMQLENDNICSVPEFTGVAVRMGKKVNDVIIGTLYHDERVKSEISEWCEIAKVLHSFKNARIGLMGHVLEAMYDMHTDPTSISATFGIHVPLLEIDDIIRLYQTGTHEEIKKKKELILQEFDMPEPKSDPVTRKLTSADLQQAASTAVALDKLVDEYKLTGLAYYYEGCDGSFHRMLASSLIVGNSILNAQGIPMCGEYDLKTCIAMLIMDRLNIGGSFAEFHPFDFLEDYILVGHDGPHHLAISEGKPVLRSLVKYHGKPGGGASVEFKLKEGPITMLGLTLNEKGKYKFVIGEGISRKGPIPPTGNTNTRGFFEPNTRDFVKAWVMENPTHHYALGIGHHAKTIEKIGEILGVESVIVKA